MKLLWKCYLGHDRRPVDGYVPRGAHWGIPNTAMPYEKLANIEIQCTLGARDFSSAVSGFCQVFIVTRAKSFSRGFAKRGFDLRPKLCRPSADKSRRTREKPLVPRVNTVSRMDEIPIPHLWSVTLTKRCIHLACFLIPSMYTPEINLSLREKTWEDLELICTTIEKPGHWMSYQFHHRVTVRNCVFIYR